MAHGTVSANGASTRRHHRSLSPPMPWNNDGLGPRGYASGSSGGDGDKKRPASPWENPGGGGGAGVAGATGPALIADHGNPADRSAAAPLAVVAGRSVAVADHSAAVADRLAAARAAKPTARNSTA